MTRNRERQYYKNFATKALRHKEKQCLIIFIFCQKGKKARNGIQRIIIFFLLVLGFLSVLVSLCLCGRIMFLLGLHVFTISGRETPGVSD